MLVAAEEIGEGESLDADICIIGAGATGIALALASMEWSSGAPKVILLESGGEELDSATQDLYEGRESGLPYFPLEATRLRYLGGSTNHWGGVCRPFTGFDFERRDWIPDSGWPIGLSDVAPFYPAAAELLGLSSAEFSSQYWIDRDPSAPLALGPAFMARVARIVGPTATEYAARHRDDLANADTVNVVLNSNVTSIRLDATGQRVSAVDVASLDGRRFSVAARSFVLAAGGIENPRILLASNSQQARGIGNQNDVVGRYFGEHPRFIAGRALPGSQGIGLGFYDQHSIGGDEVQGYAAVSEQAQRDEGLVDVQVFIEAVFDPRYDAALDSEQADALRSGAGAEDLGSSLMAIAADLQTFRDWTVPGAPLPVPYPELASELLEDAGTLRDDIPSILGNTAAVGLQRAGVEPAVQYFDLVTRLDQAPNPDSRVKLIDRRDALGTPRVALEWRLTELDMRSAERATELFGAGFAAAGLGRVRKTFDAASGRVPGDLAGGNHHMGTTRMADDPRRGVVDADCRVHGLANLHIAGSSVFATGGSSTPTLTAVALALRLSEHLREELLA